MTKKFGARSFVGCSAAVGGQLARNSLNVIGWRHTVEDGSLKLASILSVILGNP